MIWLRCSDSICDILHFLNLKSHTFYVAPSSGLKKSFDLPYCEIIFLKRQRYLVHLNWYNIATQNIGIFICMGLFIDLFFPLPYLLCHSCSSLGNPFGFSGKWISLRPHPPTHSCAHSLGKGTMTVITIIPSFRALIYFLFGFFFCLHGWHHPVSGTSSSFLGPFH